MNALNSNRLIEIAVSYLITDLKIASIIVTSDGQAFNQENYAKLHVRGTKLKYEEYLRKDLSKEITAALKAKETAEGLADKNAGAASKSADASTKVGEEIKAEAKRVAEGIVADAEKIKSDAITAADEMKADAEKLVVDAKQTAAGIVADAQTAVDGEATLIDFSIEDFDQAKDAKIIVYDKSKGFLYGENALGKSATAALAEINANQTLAKEILDAVEASKD